MAHTRAMVLSLVGSIMGGGLSGCSAVEPTTGPPHARPSVAVIVRFRSSLSEAEVRRRYPERMSAFRALPGLVQKYYLYDAGAQEWCGFYLWDSRESVEAYMRSDLKQSIGSAYGVVGQPRVEVLQLVDTLR